LQSPPDVADGAFGSGKSPDFSTTYYVVGSGQVQLIASALFSRIGTRPIIAAGAVLAYSAVFWRSRIPANGSNLTNLRLPPVIRSFGLVAVFVAVTTAANARLPAGKPGLAAALINSSTSNAGAFGLAIFSMSKARKRSRYAPGS